MMLGIAAVAHAEEVETLSGIVIVSEETVTIETELGEVVVKNGSFSSKIKSLEGNMVTVEGVISESSEGIPEVKVLKIIE